jgi:hypothetical protein
MRLVALTSVVSLPFLGLSAIASAKVVRGSSAWCAAHPAKQSKPVCANSSTGSGGGATGGGTPTIVVTASPNPVIETGQSNVLTVVQVETSPAYAGDTILLSFSQLESSCATDPLANASQGPGGRNSAYIDNDGNATFWLQGFNCAPGSDVIDASMEEAPYLTAMTTLVVAPPVVTAPGVTGYPNPEVEIGDGLNFGKNESTVFGVFYVETDPVYAEQTVTIDSLELDASCGAGWEWTSLNGATPTPYYTPPLTTGSGASAHTPPSITLDDDGNGVFLFFGASCAAGTWDVGADVNAGSHPTYVTTFTVDPPAPTI